MYEILVVIVFFMNPQVQAVYIFDAEDIKSACEFAVANSCKIYGWPVRGNELVEKKCINKKSVEADWEINSK